MPSFIKKQDIMSSTSPDGFRPRSPVRNSNSPTVRPVSNFNLSPNTIVPNKM